MSDLEIRWTMFFSDIFLLWAPSPFHFPAFFVRAYPTNPTCGRHILTHIIKENRGFEEQEQARRRGVRGVRTNPLRPKT